MELINNHFDGFLKKEDLFQFQKYPQYYKNKRYDIDFYHDFSPFKSLDTQIEAVTQKYDRRIARFYDIIRQPTLFLRYITVQDVSYINSNYDRIVEELKKFNPQNEIIFVCNVDMPLELNAAAVYYVERDPEAEVCRMFLKANDQLLQYILEQVAPATPKTVDKKAAMLNTVKKAYKKIRLRLKLVYRHHQQC